MKEADEIKKQEAFGEKVRKMMELDAKEKADKMAIELYYQGVEYANDSVPFEEIEHMGLSNEESFMKGYNETLEKLGKSR